jgi:hypothetical protein
MEALREMEYRRQYSGGKGAEVQTVKKPLRLSVVVTLW